MHLFSDYLQPLTDWLYLNPHWALFITFLISFSESLAIIGSIIPGSVTMTAVGILAGSGVMRIDLTLIAAFLGAVAGDGISYILGFAFRNRLPYLWPFSRYPHWLNYGKDYFAKHGGKSVLIGRFVGPLRSIIPVIAGMMHMNRWYFFLANVISAIGWSFLYVMPGILIGAASSELSAESASRLFILVLLFLASIWFASLGIKWLFLHAKRLLRLYLNNLWVWVKKHPKIGNFFRLITPQFETDHFPTGILVVLFILGFSFSVVVTLLSVFGWFGGIDKPIYLFLQSVRTFYFDAFFIVVNLSVGALPLLTLISFIALYAVFHRDWRTLRYWLSINIFTAAAILLLSLLVHIPQAQDVLVFTTPMIYPNAHLTFTTTLILFLSFYISARYRTVSALSIRIFLLTLLCLASISALYLGDSWFSTVVGSYFIGFTISIGHWIFYRRVKPIDSRPKFPILLSFILLIFTTAISFSLFYKKQVRTHSPYLKQYVLTDEAWWQQYQPLLPLYATNRIGQRLGLFNVQYAGSLETLQHVLEHHGWKKKSASFLHTLLGMTQPLQKPSFAAPFYHSRKPWLVMTYHPRYSDNLFILRLWRSNYHLLNQQQPIWLGSIQSFPRKGEKMVSPTNKAQLPINSFIQILSSLCCFELNHLILDKDRLKPLPHQDPPVVLLIKEVSSSPAS